MPENGAGAPSSQITAPIEILVARCYSSSGGSLVYGNRPVDVQEELASAQLDGRTRCCSTKETCDSDLVAKTGENWRHGFGLDSARRRGRIRARRRAGRIPSAPCAIVCGARRRSFQLVGAIEWESLQYRSLAPFVGRGFRLRKDRELGTWNSRPSGLAKGRILARSGRLAG